MTEPTRIGAPRPAPTRRAGAPAGGGLRRVIEGLDREAAGAEMHHWIAELFPLCRSITGEGVRQTLRMLQKLVPLSLVEVPSGTQVFDWIVPQEWTIRDAWIKGPDGAVVADFKRSNLHVVSYSVPFRGRVDLAELRTHLHTLPKQPSLIPYRTSYYQPSWGFCLSQQQADRLQPGEYEVLVDSTLANGSLTWGELVIEGSSPDEVLLSAHCCHPSLCNDNLSGLVLAVSLARLLAGTSPRYTYRFLFAPATIGAIAWLARNEQGARRIRHGLVIASVGDAGRMTYKRSRRGDAEIDRAVARVLAQAGEDHAIRDFSPYGYDERQYCSPGFDLPVGSLTRTPFGEYPEYHTSGDDLGFVKPAALAHSLLRYLEVLEVLEGNRTWVNRNPHCEPQLGRRGFYDAVRHAQAKPMAMLWVLNLSDGRHSLLDIAERSGLPFAELLQAAEELESGELLRRKEQEEVEP